MPYTRPYAGGFVNYPTTTTPIDATALNTMDVGIKTSNDQFQTVTTTQRTALSPTVGQAVWDSDLRQLMVFMNAAGGNAWQPVGNTIVCASTTRPSVPFEGQQIYETDTNKTLVYDGATWIEAYDLDTPPAAAWAAQINVQSTSTSLKTSTSSATYGDMTGLSVTITPSAATSKILVSVDLILGFSTNIDDYFVRLMRDATAICLSDDGATKILSGATFASNIQYANFPMSFTFLDSPNTTSATTYKTQFRNASGVGTLYMNRRGNDQNTDCVSNITVMEIPV